MKAKNKLRNSQCGQIKATSMNVPIDVIDDSNNKKKQKMIVSHI